MPHDFELPGGFQDADLEMRGLEEQANLETRLKKRGICTHGWNKPVELGKPARVCNDCGEVFKNEVELYEARYDAMNP